MCQFKRFLRGLSLVSVASVAMAGCRMAGVGKQAVDTPAREESAADEDPAENMRQPDEEKHLSGVDARARDIERHLGIR